MSTIDQAFVQAFARRNRRTTTTNEAAAPANSAPANSAPAPVAASSPTQAPPTFATPTPVAAPAPVQQPIAAPAASATRTAVQTVVKQKRVATTKQADKAAQDAMHWIDPAKDNLLRAEAAARESVPPHHLSEDANVTAAGPITASPSRFVNEEEFLANTLNPSGAPEVALDVDRPYIAASRHEAPSSTAGTPFAAPEVVAAISPAERPGTKPETRTSRGEDISRSSEPTLPVTERRIDSFQNQVNEPHGQSSAPQSQTATESAAAAKAATAEATPLPAIQAAWEVDVFDMPTSVMELFFQEELFQTVAQRLNDAVADGLSSMVVTSSKAGEGRSTVAIGMAMAAAATGIRVALVDGDLSDPTLVDDLRLDVDQGWYNAIKNGLPLSQVAVYSIEDNLTLIPLVAGEFETAQAGDHEIKQLFDALGQQFDLVIIDAPSGEANTIDQYAGLVDSAVIARDANRTDAETINALATRLRANGLQGIGIVENFA